MTTPQNETLNLTTLLDTLEDGRLRADLEQNLNEVIAALRAEVRLNGGIPTAALAVALSFKLEGGAIEVKAETKMKLPKENRQRTILWPTVDNKLTKRNPNQQQLPFMDVSKKPEFVAIDEEAESA